MTSPQDAFIAVLDGSAPEDWELWKHPFSELSVAIHAIEPDLDERERLYLDVFRPYVVTDPPELLLSRSPANTARFVAAVVDGLNLDLDPEKAQRLIDRFSRLCALIRSAEDPICCRLRCFFIFIVGDRVPTKEQSSLRHALETEVIRILDLPLENIEAGVAVASSPNGLEELRDSWFNSIRYMLRKLGQRHLNSRR